MTSKMFCNIHFQFILSSIKSFLILKDIKKSESDNTPIGGALGPDWSADLSMTGTQEVNNSSLSLDQNKVRLMGFVKKVLL